MKSDRTNYHLRAFFVFLMSFFVILSFSCRSIHHRGRAGSKETTRISQIGIIDSIDLTASFRGKLFFRGARARFSGMMTISSSTKARIELFSPLGKTIAVFILSDGTLSFFLPEEKMLFRGRATSDNMYRIFGIKMDPSDVLNMLTGVEQYRAGRAGAALSLKSVTGNSETGLTIISIYGDDNTSCSSIVPSKVEAYEQGAVPIIAIDLDKINDLEIHADGRLFCSEGEKRRGDDVFSDSLFSTLHGVETADIEALEIEEPIIQRMFGRNSD